MLAPKESVRPQPIAVVGDGDLISHVHRGEDERDPNNYRFSIFRFDEEHKVTQALRPTDLRDLVKLCQVLAFSITDDGWLPPDAHHALLELFEDLDELTCGWSEAKNG